MNLQSDKLELCPRIASDRSTVKFWNNRRCGSWNGKQKNYITGPPPKTEIASMKQVLKFTIVAFIFQRFYPYHRYFQSLAGVSKTGKYKGWV